LLGRVDEQQEMKSNLTAAIATNLNAPYGAVVREETVFIALPAFIQDGEIHEFFDKICKS